MIRTKPNPSQIEYNKYFAKDPAEINVLNTRTQYGFFLTAKQWARLLGFETAGILSNYIDKYIYFREHFPKNNGLFFLTQASISGDMGISIFAVNKAKQLFIKMGLISVIHKGLPAKEWFVLDFEAIDNIHCNPVLLDLIKSEGQVPCDNPTQASGDNMMQALGDNPTHNKDNKLFKDNKFNDILVSKDTLLLEKSTTDLSNDSFVDDILNYWNELDNTTIHKKDPNNKTYQTVSKLLNRLQQGLPLDHNKQNQPTKLLAEFLENSSISDNIVNLKYTEETIKPILQSISKTLKSKTGLPQVLWNSFAGKKSGYSAFYLFAAKIKIETRFIKIAELLQKHACSPINRVNSDAFEIKRELYARDIGLQEAYILMKWGIEHSKEKYTPKFNTVIEFFEKFTKLRDQKDKKIESPFGKGQGNNRSLSKIPIEYKEGRKV